MRDRSEQWKAWEARNTALVERIHAARTDELRTTPDLAAERDALQARLDEAVELLREASDVINLPWHDARRAFLSRINADGGVK